MNTKPVAQRIASSVAGFFGVRLYNLYYAEKSLLTDIEAVDFPIELLVREATAKDPEAIVERLGPKIRKNFNSAEAFGSTCFIALHQGKIAGYTWINRRYIDLVGHIATKLPEEGFYSYNSFVFPEYRGKRLRA